MIVSISREYGSGGRLIGREAAELLGFPFYDKQMISLIAEESGLTESYVEEHQETGPRNWLRDVAFRPDQLAAEDLLLVAERHVIRKLAEQHENLVIVGRSADYYLRGRVPHLKVFIHSDADTRRVRLEQYYELGEANASERRESVDKQRAKYYRKVTGREWGAAEHYDLMINSRIGLGAAAKLIAEAVEAFGEGIHETVTVSDNGVDSGAGKVTGEEDRN